MNFAYRRARLRAGVCCPLRTITCLIHLYTLLLKSRCMWSLTISLTSSGSVLASFRTSMHASQVNLVTHPVNEQRSGERKRSSSGKVMLEHCTGSEPPFALNDDCQIIVITNTFLPPPPQYRCLPRTSISITILVIASPVASTIIIRQARNEGLETERHLCKASS